MVTVQLQVINDTNEVNFTPDWVWVKEGAQTHDLLFDSLRGVTKWLDFITNHG